MRNKVLIVEDNPELLGILRLALQASGLSVATAKDGIQALKKARTLLPDLVVLDLVLPELDGFAVCETLRKAPATASIPVIILTGLSSQLARLASVEFGADDYLMKPVSPSLLVERIQMLLARPKPEPSSPAKRSMENRTPRSPLHFRSVLREGRN